MSLAKIPCILVAMVGLQITVTPPHPPPSPDEKALSTALEIILKQRSGPLILKSVCWTMAMAEIAVILASHARDYDGSREILSMLLKKGTVTAEGIKPPFLFWFGCFSAAMGGFIRHRCYRELGWLFTFEMSIRKDHRLIKSGPYEIVRHPGYTGILFTVVGMLCWHASPGSWVRECGIFDTRAGRIAVGMCLGLVSIITGALLSRMSKEDEALAKTFGHEWTEWAAAVPYKLIPKVY